MKTLFIALLVATLCIGKGTPLTCYKCGRPTASRCRFTTECKESEKYCVLEHITASTQIGLVKMYNRRCSRSCPENRMEKKVERVVLKCCDTDKCND